MTIVPVARTWEEHKARIDALIERISPGRKFSRAAEHAAQNFWLASRGLDPLSFSAFRVPPEMMDDEGRVSTAHLIVAIGWETSLSNARRSIKQGIFTIGPNRASIRDPMGLVYIHDGLVVRLGKRKIVGLIVE